MLILFFAWAAAAASPAPVLFETMLEERAFVIDLRATISVPTAADHLRAYRDWPLSAGLCHRLEREIEASFETQLLHVGHYYENDKPDLPRVLMRLEFDHGEMGEARRAKNRQTFTRILNGRLRVILLPSAREITGIPVRFALTRDAYGEYDAFKALRLLDVDGRGIARRVPGEQASMVRIRNERVLLDALFARAEPCDRLLF